MGFRDTVIFAAWFAGLCQGNKTKGTEPMNSKSLFGVVVRTFGLYCAYESLTHLLYFLDLRIGLSQPLRFNAPAIHTGYLVYVISYAVGAFLLIRHADSIVTLAYSDETEKWHRLAPRRNTICTTCKESKPMPSSI